MAPDAQIVALKEFAAQQGELLQEIQKARIEAHDSLAAIQALIEAHY